MAKTIGIDIDFEILPLLMSAGDIVEAWVSSQVLKNKAWLK